MNKFICATTALFLTGCTATDTLPESKLADGQAYLAPIYVMVDDPFMASDMRNHLRETGVFSAVKPGAGKAEDYTVHIKLQTKTEHPPFPVVLLSCATLFMLPLSKEIVTQTQFTVVHDGKSIKEYSYSNNTQKYTFLLDQGGEMQGQNFTRIARAFARDVRNDRLLPNAEGVL
jgi:hypothetical protein